MRQVVSKQVSHLIPVPHPLTTLAPCPWCAQYALEPTQTADRIYSRLGHRAGYLRGRPAQPYALSSEGTCCGEADWS
jgi:hypothetical protein